MGETSADYYKNMPECRESGSDRTTRVLSFSKSKALRKLGRSCFAPQKSPGLLDRLFVGMPRIELGPLAPKASTLPLCYIPTNKPSPREYTTIMLRPEARSEYAAAGCIYRPSRQVESSAYIPFHTGKSCRSGNTSIPLPFWRMGAV